MEGRNFGILTAAAVAFFASSVEARGEKILAVQEPLKLVDCETGPFQKSIELQTPTKGLVSVGIQRGLPKEKRLADLFVSTDGQFLTIPQDPDKSYKVDMPLDSGNMTLTVYCRNLDTPEKK